MSETHRCPLCDPPEPEVPDNLEAIFVGLALVGVAIFVILASLFGGQS